MGSKTKDQAWKEALHNLDSKLAALTEASHDVSVLWGIWDQDYADLSECHVETIHGHDLAALADHDTGDLTYAIEQIALWTAKARSLTAPTGNLSPLEDPPCIRCGAPESVCECPDDLVGGFRLVEPVAVDDEK